MSNASSWDLLLDYDRPEDLPGAGWHTAEEVDFGDWRGIGSAVLLPEAAVIQTRGFDGLLSEPKVWPAGRTESWGDPIPVHSWRVVGDGGVPLPDSSSVHAVVRARMERAGYRVVAWLFEPSTNGFHAKVRLDPPPGSPMEVVALQAVCGSDPLREACNVQRARGVQDMGAYAAVVLLRELDGGAHITEVMDRARPFLAERAAAPDSFFVQRWNTLYAPNPLRRRTDP